MNLLFVCTGNICRSPMAAALAAASGARRGLDLSVASAGVLDLGPRPAEPNAIAVLAERGLDLRPHRAQQVTPELLAWADHSLCMELEHASTLRTLAPQLADRVQLLGPYARVAELPDPMGGWRWTFRTSRDQLERAVEGFLDRLPA